MIKFKTTPTGRVRLNIDESGTSWVEIRAKMNAGVKAAVHAEITSVSVQDAASGNASIGFSDLKEKLAVLKHNIVEWGGPLFIDENMKPVPYSREVLMNLDPEESKELIEFVYDEVNKRNQPAGGADPLPASDTSAT